MADQEVFAPDEPLPIRQNGGDIVPVKLGKAGKKRRLTQKQKAAIAECVSTGCTVVQAAERIGATRASGSRWAHDELFLAELRTAVERKALERGVKGMANIEAIADNARSELVRLEANKELVKAAGLDDRNGLRGGVGGLTININLGRY